MTVYEIPLTPAQPSKFDIVINDTIYNLSFQFADAPDGGWLMNIADQYGTAIVNGIPLVTGADLLAQYGEYNFGFVMYVATDGIPAAVPTWGNLGSASHLYVSY